MKMVFLLWTVSFSSSSFGGSCCVKARKAMWMMNALATVDADCCWLDLCWCYWCCNTRSSLSARNKSSQRHSILVSFSSFLSAQYSVVGVYIARGSNGRKESLSLSKGDTSSCHQDSLYPTKLLDEIYSFVGGTLTNIYEPVCWHLEVT